MLKLGHNHDRFMARTLVAAIDSMVTKSLARDDIDAIRHSGRRSLNW